MKPSQWTGTVPVFFVLFLGVVFLGLDVLDINEDFRLHLPTSVLNTIFISGIGFVVACLSARRFMLSGTRLVLWLGSGTLAMGLGNLARVLLAGEELSALITLFETSVLVSAILHFVGAAFAIKGKHSPMLQKQRKARSVVWIYGITLIAIGLIVASAVQGITTGIYLPEDGSGIRRDIFRGITALFFFVSSLATLALYARSRAGFYFWYSMGLMLMALGVVFMSQGVDNRVAWLGRAALYVGNLYLLFAVFTTGMLHRTKQELPSGRSE